MSAVRVARGACASVAVGIAKDARGVYMDPNDSQTPQVEPPSRSPSAAMHVQAFESERYRGACVAISRGL